MMKTIKKLLVIRLSALGDICMTLPVIDSFCRAYPDIQVTLLTSKPGAAITRSVLHLPNLNIHAINKADYSGLGGLNCLYKEMKALQFDAVADLHDVLRSKWIDLRFRIAGHPVQVIDKGRKQKKQLIRHEVVQQLKSGTARYYEVFQRLGFEFPVDYQGAMHRLPHDVQQPAIGIAPFAQHQGKIYPLDLMQEVIEQLVASRPDLHIVLFGGKEDADTLQPWADRHPERITNVAGKQTFAEDLAMMSSLNLMVSMDSANMHLASLVGLRCLSIWGATHRYAGFLGYGQQEADCIERPLSCRPCSIYGNKPCHMGDYPCLKKITPQVVAERILNALHD